MFVGDIMNHEIQMNKAWNGTKYDYNDFFKHIKKELKSVDFCVGNLETVFGGEPYAGIPQEFGHDSWRFSTPDSLAYALANAGVNCLVTANNHSADCSAEGIERTIESIERTKNSSIEKI